MHTTHTPQQRVSAFTADPIGGEPLDRVLEVHGFRWLRGFRHVDVTVMGPRGRTRRLVAPFASFTTIVHEEER